MERAMLHTQATRSESTFSMATVALGIVVFIAAGTIPARGQAFADLKSALVDYSKADLEPRKACEALGKFQSKDIAQITATLTPGNAMVPAHCRVTGLLSP